MVGPLHRGKPIEEELISSLKQLQTQTKTLKHFLEKLFAPFSNVVLASKH